MTRMRKIPWGLMAVGLLCLLPAGASAGPLLHSLGQPDLGYQANYYSPCHYWTPLLYRCYAKCYYGVCGHGYSLDYYPTVPCAEPGPSPSNTPAETGGTKSGPKEGSSEQGVR
jgi:hypothetical protein